ncbi:MAG: AEC family transporter [Actinomycetota bacterium]
MTEIINRVLPIILLIALGFWIRRSGFVTQRTVDDLRKIVVNLALPAVLFTAFLDLALESRSGVVAVATFLLSIVLYLLGRALRPRFGARHDYFPFLMTGFEAGMLGISLYGAAYGLERIGSFAIVDLGHEIFIWFVFLALLLAKRDGTRHPRTLLRSFIRSPVVIAIIAGIALNFVGARDVMYEAPIIGGVMNTLAFMGTLTVPLILLIVGYGIRLDRRGFKEALIPVVVRATILLPLAFVLPPLLMSHLLGADEYAQAALFTLLVLPPPFIIPLYMKQGMDDERRYVNNVLSLYTLVSIAVFIGYVSLNPL